MTQIDTEAPETGVEGPSPAEVVLTGGASKKERAFVGKIIPRKRFCDKCEQPGTPIRETNSSSSAVPCWRDLCATCIKAVFGEAAVPRQRSSAASSPTV